MTAHWNHFRQSVRQTVNPDHIRGVYRRSQR